jgi:hypothetical protein
MKKLLKFIIDQEIEDYNEIPRLLVPLSENFNIKDYNGKEATMELLMAIVWWESHPEIYESLEEILNKKFILL